MLTKREQELILRLRNGDARAFVELVEEYRDLIFTLGVRMLTNREDAEEVSQDVFLKVHASLHRFKGESKLSTWIYRIAYNACLDKIKRNKRETLYLESREPWEVEVGVLDNAFERMVQRERSAMIKACLAKLSAEDAGILTLFYYGEMTLLELEKIMGLSANTLKVRLFRARKRLAEVMGGSLGNEIFSNYG